MRRSLFAALAAVFLATPAHALSPDEWREDLRTLIDLVESRHPDPYTKVSREDFRAQAARLDEALDSLDDTETAIAMMQLIASIGDGHTTLHPKGEAGFTHWLPLSFYWFEDGVYVVSAHRDYEDLLKKKVVGIGDGSIDTLLPAVTALMGADNEAGRRQKIYYLGSADALRALGFVDDVDVIPVTIEEDDGRRQVVPVTTVERQDFILDESRFWGEMFAPVPNDVLDEFVMPFDGLGVKDFWEARPEEKTDLPLHVRHRRAYWSIYLPEESTYYLQFNFTTSRGTGDYASFEAFYNEVFDWLAENPVDKFVLDIRYNFGGDGSILTPFVHKFIRDDHVNRPGHLYTITGRKSYSAATMLLDLMLEHTNTILVGEPIGSALNSYGDPETRTLPNSGMTLDVSSEYWKLVHTSDSPPLTPIDIPAVFTSADYFERRDPAMEQILAVEGRYRTLDEVLASEGGAEASKRYEEEKMRNQAFAWWRPFDESAFRKIARGFTDDGNFEDGIAGFEILVDAYPDSWRAWRDFGKALLDQGDRKRAVDCLLRAQAINPGSQDVNQLVAELSD